MSLLAARDALTPGLKRVIGDDRAGFATPSVFAVFATHEPDAALMGLVTLEQARQFSHRIFADLLPAKVGSPVAGDADLETVSNHMEAAPGSALAVLDETGQFIGAITRESLWAAMVTQQRALLSELASREAQNRAMLRALPDQLLCVDADGKLLEIGRGDAPVDTAGIPGGRLDVEDSCGKALAEVFPEDVAATLRDGVRRSRDSSAPWHASFSVAERGVTNQYEARFVSLGRGNVLIICRDVTEVNALRAKLIVSDRMISIGTLAAGVAHEINNPLTYVSTNLEMLHALLAAEGGHNQRLRDATSLLDDMRDGVDRVERTVRDLTLFSRSEDEPPRTVTDIKAVLRRILRMADNEIRHRATLSLDLGDVPAVVANDGQLGQVFLNLLVNAAQSIPEGGADRNQVRVVSRTDSQGRAVVEIHDTGCGIPEAIRTRIFAPFFTTKEPSVGTGLGLSICHGIVLSHGGLIEVDSVVGAGSMFRIVLPSSSTPLPAPVPARPSAPAVGACPVGRFLAIDDELAILRSYPRMLGAQQCVTFSSGREALELLRGGTRFDAILCDLMMPQMTGMDLYEALLQVAPDQAARIVFVTGGAFTDRARQFLAARTNLTLDKPFTSRNLFDCITKTMVRAGSSRP